jgi:voltage-gated potassium channel
MNRAYVALTGQWLDYMLHLRRDYPYLYSLATRTNPFNEKASAEIR